jgi:hypothetical protein
MNALLHDRSVRLDRLRSSITPLALLAALIIGPAVACQVIDERTWAHVDLGETILRMGHLPTGTQVGDGYRWMSDSHLAQISLAVAHRVAGPAGLGILAVCIGFGLIAMLAWILRDEQTRFPAIAISILSVAVLLAPWWKLVPILFSIIWFTMMIALLQFAFRGWQGKWLVTSSNRRTVDGRPVQDELRYESARLRWLWLAGPLFFVWANSNSAFRVGLAVFCVYLAGRAIEAICQRGWAGWGLFRRMALMATVAVLATLINPYGPWLYGWLASPAGAAQRAYLDGHTDLLWQPWLATAAVLLMVTAGVAGWSLIHQRLDLARWLGLAAAACAVWLDPKHVPFLVIAASAWLTCPVSEWLRSVVNRWATFRPLAVNGIPWYIAAASSTGIQIASPDKEPLTPLGSKSRAVEKTRTNRTDRKDTQHLQTDG